MFLSSADRVIGMGNEEVGVLLAVVRVRSAPDSTSQRFLLVLGLPVVPWEVVALPRLSLGGHEQLGPYSVACPRNCYPMGFTTHRSTRARTDAGAAVDQLTYGSSDTLLALDGFQALRLMLVTAGKVPSASSPWSPLFSSGAPVLPEGEATRFVSGTEESAVVGMWIHCSALPLPPHHGLPLGFVANPAFMSSSASFVQALESWSGVTDSRWDWLINPYYDAWFAAQSRAPNELVMDICSASQIQSDCSKRTGALPPSNQKDTVSFGAVDPMLHIASSLWHRVFCDALMARASKHMAAKFWDFEARAIAVFQEGEENWLGPHEPAMQPFLYCLAQPATLAWASKSRVIRRARFRGKGAVAR